MAEIKTLKCPNCAGPIVFDPGEIQIQCGYCDSIFTPEELLKLSEQTFATSEIAPAPDEPLYGYNCSNCGANVWTDDTTLATYCFYCHSPVIVAPRIAGDFAPDGLIPFSVDQDEVVSAFTKWSKTRKFTPRDFGTKEHLDQLNGVYLPFWQADGSAKYRIIGEGVNTHESRMGNVVTTSSEFYEIDRGGIFEANAITSLANDKAAEQLVIGTDPFSEGEIMEFNPAYLQGFFAERNNIAKEQAEDAFVRKIQADATGIVSNSVDRYYDKTSTKVEFLPLQLTNWRLLLHPFWLLTYRQDDTTFLYCMNGVTGESYGELPVSSKRLLAAALLLGLAVFIVLMLLGYLI
ncbi:MAG TPA: hypothetical protein GXZ59_07900 [Clostridiaceae bacterium]|nr:hypothetical protein [Clostridiaceae bacterium]